SSGRTARCGSRGFPCTSEISGEAMLFSERQRFTQWWMWLLLLGSVAPLWYGVYRQVVQGRPWGTNPAGDAALVGIWLIAGVGLPVFFAAMHLRTEVHADRICIRLDRKSTRLNSSHVKISYAVFCLKKKT